MDTTLHALTTAAAAALSIGLWTFRVALAGRGRRLAAAALAGVEAVLFVTIFTSLVASLGDPTQLTAYAVGVGGGTLLGLLADERWSTGQSEVRLVVAGDGAAARTRLHLAGWPATATTGAGPSGPVTTLSVAVDDRCLDDLLRTVTDLEPAPFVTVERLRTVRPVAVPAGFVQVGASRRRTRVPS